MPRNFLTPDIDTSGLRTADIQATNTNYLNQLGRAAGLRNILTERAIEKLPETEARADEIYNLKKETDQFTLLKSKAAIAADFLPQVTQDSYDDYLNWMDEIGLPSAKLMKPAKEVQGMTPEQFELYKRQSQVDASDLIKMSLEQFKALAASELEKQKHGHKSEQIKQTHEGTMREIEARGQQKEKGGKGFEFKVQDEKYISSSIAGLFENSIRNPITNEFSYANNKDAQIGQGMATEAIQLYRDAGGDLTREKAVNIIAKKYHMEIPSAEQMGEEKFEAAVKKQYPDAVKEADGNWYIMKDKKKYRIEPE